jgi:hypothetical protein
MPRGVVGGNTSAERARRERANGYVAAQEAVRQARLNGGGTVAAAQRQRPKESWEILSEWAEKRGWGSYRLAGAILLAATEDERKRMCNSQHALASHCRRWLKGEIIPDGHRRPENAVYRPVLARLMGTTPDMIWKPRKPKPETVMDHKGKGGDFGRNGPFGGSPVHGALKRRLSVVSSTLEEYRKELEYLEQVKKIVGELEAEVDYLKTVLAIPVPEDMPMRQVDSSDTYLIQE